MSEEILPVDDFENWLYAGGKLSAPTRGEEICITGIAGKFPNSNDVADFMSNLFNKVDLCDDDDRRWSHAHPEIPKVSGKIYDIDRFDSGYFGFENYHANVMDPMGRLIVERAIEAIFDAGINPNDLRGSNTGVFIGACAVENEKFSYYELNNSHTHGVMSCMKSMLPQRIAYHLQLNGPTFACDTACSSGIYAFDCAYRAIREGKCEQAIVGGTNLCMDPCVTLQFARLGVLNMNTGCRPFDKNASGYTRSEAIVSIFLQKSKDAKRIYAKVVHSKTNSDGYKEEGITFPSAEAQICLLADIYKECGVSPLDVGYVEAHGTGTKVGDPEEMQALDKFYCTNRPQPLLSGSVKSNIGHTEPASGLCSLVKVLYAMETANIPPSIHYENPREDIEALVSKRVKIVDEITPWPSDSIYGGVNSFGFGGANGHILLELNTKPTINQCVNIPILMCSSARTMDGLKAIQDFTSTHKDNYNVLSLLQNIFKSDTKNHPSRGFSILTNKEEIKRSSAFYDDVKRPLYLCIGNDGVYSENMMHSLTQFEVAMNIINSINNIIDENQLVGDIWNDKLESTLITMTVQIALIEILKHLNIEFSKIRSYANVDFVSAYANGTLSLEETVKCTYVVGTLNTEQIIPTNNLHRILQIILGDQQRNVNCIETSKSNAYPFGSIAYFTENVYNKEEQQFDEFDKKAVVLTFNCQPKVDRQHIINVPDSSQIENVLSVIGQLYECGYSADLTKIYPQTQWPVNRGTPMLSPLIDWKHRSSFFYKAKLNDVTTFKDPERSFAVSNDAASLKGHIIDGRNLYPAMGYILAIWEFFADVKRHLHQDLKVTFKNVQFIRAHTISQNVNSYTGFYLQIMKSGYFEVCESNSPLVTGYVDFYEDDINNIFEYQPSEYKLVKKDIYKELRLRGYNYKGNFQAVNELSGTSGLIEWNNNWVTFMDNMLQVSILSENSKALFVPTGIEELIIDARQHLQYVKQFENNLIPVRFDKNENRIQTKFIEIRGLKATSITRKRQANQPIIEKNIFVPNITTMSIDESLRVITQLLTENKQLKGLKVVELIDRTGYEEYLPFAPYINNAIKDLPVIQSEIVIFSDLTFEELDGNTKVEKLAQYTPAAVEANNNLFVGINLLRDVTKLQEIKKYLTPPGFVISIEDTLQEKALDDYAIFTIHRINDKYIHLLKTKEINTEPTYIDVSDVSEISGWIPNIQKMLKSSQNIVLYSHNNSLSGILGFVNCLRREPAGDNVRCFFIMDEAFTFDPNNKLFATQVSKEMAINVFKNGEWGTYRHLLLPPPTMSPSLRYSVLNTKGDLSSIRWERSFVAPDELDLEKTIYTTYCALNFRDVMLATGKLSDDAVYTTRKPLQSTIGFEYSGKYADGRRVMGLSAGGSLTNIIESNKLNCVWAIPDEWSLAEAATVPVVYATVLYAFKHCPIKAGQSILIHSGTGGIGLAAINVCTHLKLNIFTTVGSQEKVEFLLKTYPHLKRSQIGNSRDTSFEQMVYKETNGRGVEYVLNSLAEEKLQASVRCLAKNGVFLEIGKFDLAKDSRLYMDLLEKNCKFCGIMLDRLLLDEREGKEIVDKILYDAIADGYVKPLPYKVFEQTDCESAFRHMTTGKHMGKVLLQINEDVEKQLIERPCLPRFTANPKLSYVVIGGLGGFGLELADWLVMRGVKNLILSSRSGVKDGYQHLKIEIWKKFDVRVVVSTEDVTTYEGCKKLIEESESIAPIAAIFNLAVVLKDSIFENQNCESFETSLKPKAIATKYLDEITRAQCSKLEHFVVFSSVSCGRGNAGQTNYGMSNSIMERICEKRKADGLPALAIQWGAVGDVGLVAEMQKDHTEIAIGGTLQQRISSCLEVMDQFLTQNEAIVSSIIVAEKSGMGSESNMVDAVARIVGIKDLKTISLHSTLPELGMDSMMAVEIKQLLETEYDIFLSAQDMRTLTFSKLIELNSGVSDATNLAQENVEENNINILIQAQTTNSLRHLPYIYLSDDKQSKNKIFAFPGIDCNVPSLQNCADNLPANLICAQYSNEDYKQSNVEDIVNYLWEHLQVDFQDQECFKMIAHSYGCIMAIEIAAKLEELGFVGKIALVDASPKLMLQLCSMYNSSTDEVLQITCILAMMSSILSADQLVPIKEELLKAENYAQRKEISMKYLPDSDLIGKEELVNVGDKIFYRFKTLTNYSFEKKLNSKMLLCKPTIQTIKQIAEDYHLSDISTQNVEVEYFEGNHQTILANPKLPEKLAQFFE